VSGLERGGARLVGPGRLAALPFELADEVVVVSAYADASQGSNPNVGRYTDPASVAGRCSVVARATAP
jgi:hypothetical protein